MAQAVYTGKQLERFVRNHLEACDYTYVQNRDFFADPSREQPIYSRQVEIGLSIYETPIKCDFILYHPTEWRDRLVIECKWQQVVGSVDEKYPYLILNIQERYNCPTILLLDGGGYKQGAEDWIRNQAGVGNLLKVFNMTEFQAWANQGNLGFPASSR